MSFTLNGTAYDFVVPEDTLMTYKTDAIYTIEAERKGFVGPYCAIWLKNLERTGDYAAHMLEVGLGVGPDGKDIAYYSSSTNPATVTVTSYGAIGEYIEGRFSGMFYPNNGAATVPVSGTFRVKRTK